jgi:hypothetical protein
MCARADHTDMNAATPQTAFSSRGAPRLLEHCAALDRTTQLERGSAWIRLETELGGELARLLRGALADQGRRTGFVVV